MCMRLVKSEMDRYSRKKGWDPAQYPQTRETTLVHELAHAFYELRHGTGSGEPSDAFAQAVEDAYRNALGLPGYGAHPK
jgi:hypothetical protein